MKTPSLSLAIVISLMLVCATGCTRQDNAQAERKLHEAGQELKHDTRTAAEKLRQGAHEAAQELRKDAHEASAELKKGGRELKRDLNSK